MPMYEYHCEDCGQDFEKLVRFADAGATQICPACSGKRTLKKISISAAIGSAISGNVGVSASSSGCGSGGRFT